MTTLDFVVIGAEKSGTTLLVDRLRLSPALSMPLHEVRHFRDPFYPDRERIEDQFDPSDRRIKGIKHPSYLARPEAPARLHAHNPKLKLIALLREPSGRLIVFALRAPRPDSAA